MGRLYRLRNYGYVEINDEIWFSNLFFNALIKINKLTGKIQYINKFPNYDVRQEVLYSAVCYINGQLIFIPHDSEEIVSYDMKTGKFDSIDMDKECIGEEKAFFLMYYIYGHYVYMFPVRSRCIIKYDVKKKVVKYLGGVLKEIMCDLPRTAICFGKEYEIIDDKLYIPFVDLNAVAIFDLNTEILDIKYLHIRGGCSTIDYIEGFFYLASSKYPLIYRWDVSQENVVAYSGFPEGFEIGKGVVIFHNSCNIGERIFFFPFLSNMIISFDTITKRIKREEFRKIPDEEPLITYLIQKNGDKSFLLTADEENLCVLNYENKRVQMNPYFKLDNSYNKKVISKFLQQCFYYNICMESKKALKEYIEILTNLDNNKLTRKMTNCGKKIFDALRDN